MRENDAIKRHNKHKMYEDAVGVTGHTVLQQSFYKYEEYPK